MLAVVNSDFFSAAQHFGSSVSIFDMLGDRYRPRALIANSDAPTRQRSPAGQLSTFPCCNAFRELGAKLDKAAEVRSLNLDRTALKEMKSSSALPQCLHSDWRAVTSRELLLRELAASCSGDQCKIRDHHRPGEHNHRRVVIAHGCTPAESAKIAEEMDQLVDDESQATTRKKNDATILQLRSSHGPPATLYISPSSRVVFQADSPGTADASGRTWYGCLCTAGRFPKGLRVQQPAELPYQSPHARFIHSSPAMTKWSKRFTRFVRRT